MDEQSGQPAAKVLRMHRWRLITDWRSRDPAGRRGVVLAARLPHQMLPGSMSLAVQCGCSNPVGASVPGGGG
jgi:hypothetical protein